MSVHAPAASSADHSLLLRAVAGHGLAGSMLGFPTEPVEDGEWRLLLGAARRQRVQGLLWDAVVSGALPTTDEQFEQAEALQVKSLSGCLVLERLLIETVDLFESAGIPTRLLKGAASARLDYQDVCMRAFGDVDLLVPGEHFDSAVALLVAHGHQRIYQEPRPGFDKRYGKGASFRSPDGMEIDLHRTFTMGPFGLRLDLPAIWERSEELSIGEVPLLALGPEERLLHACFHAVLGEVKPRLVPLRDLAQLALTRHLDLVRFHALVRSSRAEAVVSTAVRLAWSELDIADITALSAWAHAVQVDPRGAADLAVYGESSSYTTKAIAAVRSLPTTRDKVSYVMALVAPQKSYLGHRHASRTDRIRHGLRQRSELQRTRRP